METKTPDLLQDVSITERSERLKAMATKVEMDKVRRYYNEDEKNQIKDSVTSDSIEIMDKQEEFKAIKKEFDAAIKTSKNSLVIALKDIKRGYSENDEEVVLIDDQDAGLMNIYDLSGTFIRSRKLFPEERQTTILAMKTGTHN